VPDSHLSPLPPLHALRAFHAAARFGRFREAASALGLTESAVSHQVRKLETFLQVPLFERAGNRVSLTPAGQTYFAEVDPAFARIRAATDALGRPAHRVALTLPSCLATLWLIPRLAGLEAEFPEISLQLMTTTRLCDLKREQIDLGIRYGVGHWTGLAAEHLFDEQAFPVCSPGLLGGEGPADPLSALRSARLIANSGHPEEWNEWARAHDLEPPSLKGAILLDSSEQILEAASQGLGLAIGRQPMLARYLAEGRVVAPFGDRDLSGCAYFLVHPDDLELNVATRRVARWIAALAAENRPAAA
jgi:LysR family glycine cleavage system transcriptional activator